jgi:Ca2+-binding RTX toxin-like protein
VIQTGGTPGETLWTSAQVDTISTGKLVLGYLNVAKINDYTSMWNPNWTDTHTAGGTNVPGQAPDFLRQDGATANTRLVDITKASWIAALHARIDILIAQHFDGMFLDDVLRYYVPYNVTLGASARAMRDLIIDITAYARQQNPNFIVMENGGPDLISHTTNDGAAADPAKAALFYGSIDAFLAESYFRDPGSGQENTYGINTAIANYGTQGIALFSADQLVPAGQAATILLAADTAGFIPFTIPGSNYGYADSTRFASTMGDNAPGADELRGGDGSDQLIGSGGGDFLDGGTGADRMTGNAGNDTYIVDNAADAVTETAGQGFDSIYSFVSYALSANADVDWLSTIDNNATTAIDLTGSAIGQYLIGNQGANILDGKAGADFMQGFGGNDIYYVDNGSDAPVEAAGGGTDAAFTTISYGLANGTSIEILGTTSVAGTGAINLLGNEIANSLIGNAGANSLDGAGGADTMTGYGGNDTYIVDDSGDAVVEAASGGFDAIYTIASYTLGAGSEVEWLSAATVGSTTALNLTGNAFNNYVLGNNGANLINGGAGNDTLYGYGGADSFQFTTALGAGNVDVLTDFVSGTDKIALDDAVFTQIGGLGALSAAAFVTGASATTTAHRIVYNGTTGQLFYDADGSGAGAAVLFATLQGNPAIGAGDFTVI